MFICEKCAKEYGAFWIGSSRGLCEECGEGAVCSDIPSKYLSSLFKENRMPNDTENTIGMTASEACASKVGDDRLGILQRENEELSRRIRLLESEAEWLELVMDLRGKYLEQQAEMDKRFPPVSIPTQWPSYPQRYPYEPATVTTSSGTAPGWYRVEKCSNAKECWKNGEE